MANLAVVVKDEIKALEDKLQRFVLIHPWKSARNFPGVGGWRISLKEVSTPRERTLTMKKTQNTLFETGGKISVKQTLANTSMWYSNLTKNCPFINYLCLNLWWIIPKYLLRPQVEYLHFRRIRRILVEARRISSNYLCFWPFVGQSRIIIRLWCHVTRITWIKIQLITQKWLNIIPYLAECYSIFASRSNISTSNHHFFVICLDDESQSRTPLHWNLV